MRVLVVSKLPVLDRYQDEQLARLQAEGFGRESELREGKQQHQDSLALVVEALSGHDHEVVEIDRLDRSLVQHRDLVVTVGGDGTVLATHGLLDGTPLLAVNSDPAHSLGHFTRCHADSFARIFAAWREGDACEDLMFRLRVRLRGDGEAHLVLNECLVTNRNPALMSRYQLRDGERREEQYSSGLWISTPAGSTGAISSAGMSPRPELDAALLYKVREAFPGRGPFDLLEGVQDPPRGLSILPIITGMACYLDGGYRPCIDLDVGQELLVAPSDQPLRLIALA